MGDLDEGAGIDPGIRDAVVLRLDHDLLQRSGLCNVAEHGVELSFALHIAHQDEHSATLFQGGILFEAAVVHLLHKLIPVLAAGEVVRLRIEPVTLYNLLVAVLLAGICLLYTSPSPRD